VGGSLWELGAAAAGVIEKTITPKSKKTPKAKPANRTCNLLALNHFLIARS
jgi:hypothetical protein